MIRHVIMWQFKAGEQAHMQEFLDQLRALKGVIPQIIDMEIGVNENESNNFDAVLIATFETMADMRAYQTDARHVAVSALCKAIRTERAAVDFTI